MWLFCILIPLFSFMHISSSGLCDSFVFWSPWPSFYKLFIISDLCDCILVRLPFLFSIYMYVVLVLSVLVHGVMLALTLVKQCVQVLSMSSSGDNTVYLCLIPKPTPIDLGTRCTLLPLSTFQIILALHLQSFAFHIYCALYSYTIRSSRMYVLPGFAPAEFRIS